MLSASLSGLLHAQTLEESPAPPTVPLRPQGPLRLPFVTPVFGGGFLLESDQWRFGWGFSHSNIHTFSPKTLTNAEQSPTIDEVIDRAHSIHDTTGDTVYYFDAETTRIDLTLHRGLPGGWEVGVDLPLITRVGGALDRIINEFHDEFGFPDAYRDESPENANATLLLTKNGDITLTGDDLEGTVLGDLALSAQYRLPLGRERFRAETSVVLELPTGDAETLAGSGTTDVALAFSAGWSFRNSRLVTGAGYAFLGGLTALPGVQVSDTVTATVSYQYHMTRRTWFLMQFVHSTPPYHKLESRHLDLPTELVAVGPRVQIGNRWYLDLTVVEDLFYHGADLDVGALVNLSFLP